jgi:hypothetical protein
VTAFVPVRLQFREANVKIGELTCRTWEVNPVGHADLDGPKITGFDGLRGGPVQGLVKDVVAEAMNRRFSRQKPSGKPLKDEATSLDAARGRGSIGWHGPRQA